MISNAVGTERISQVVGYKITKGNFNETSPNLPQYVAIFGEANVEFQDNLSTTPVEVTSAQQAGTLYGFGSPIYHVMRILRPVNGGGIGGIKTFVYPQLSPESATTKILKVEITGTATANGTHTVVIAGRNSIDAQSYSYNVATGDTPDDIYTKIENAVNAVIGSPVNASASEYDVEFESKWAGATAEDLSISIDTNGNTLGLTYAISDEQTAIGTPSISASLNLISNVWATILVNTYGTNTTVMSALEAFNGIPDPTNPTGRFAAIVMKPFIALTGSTIEDPSSITDSRKANCTIAICPAPLSEGLPLEAAANACLLLARINQDTPHLDISSLSYPDMPTPTAIGAMSIYDNRDAIVKKGCSTVDLVNGAYKVMDFVTTYHPVGEIPAQFAYVRSLTIDFNIRYGYYLLEQQNVEGCAILTDDQTSDADNTIKPIQWKSIITAYADDLDNRALIADPSFMKSSIVVGLSTTNPDRLESFFRYKRSGFFRIGSTTAEAGFNFGN
jgi:phage tail sheath gpL-like